MRRAVCILLGVAVAATVATGCSGAHEPARQEAPPARPPARPTTNVPALLGQPIEQVHQRLGVATALPPTYEDMNSYAHLAPQVTDSVRAFRAGELLLVASYDLQTRRVHDLLLLGRHEDVLMQQAALQPNSPNYLVMPVFQSNHPGVLLGLRVIDTSTQD